MNLWPNEPSHFNPRRAGEGDRLYFCGSVVSAVGARFLLWAISERQEAIVFLLVI